MDIDWLPITQGNRNSKVEPFPSAEWYNTRDPPRSSASSLEILSPRPVPPHFLVIIDNGIDLAKTGE